MIGCPGPQPADYHCSLLESRTAAAERLGALEPPMDSYGCPIVEDADVLIYDPWLYVSEGAPDARELLRALRRRYPHQPLVLAWAEEGKPAFEPDITADPGVYIGPRNLNELVGLVGTLMKGSQAQGPIAQD